DLRWPREEPCSLHLEDARNEGLTDPRTVRFGMRRRQKRDAPVPDVDALVAKPEEDETSEREVVGIRELEPRAAARELVGRRDAFHERIDLGDELAVPRADAALQIGAGLLDVQEGRLASGERERMTHERAGEVGDAHLGNGSVAVVPGSAVERIHEARNA